MGLLTSKLHAKPIKPIKLNVAGFVDKYCIECHKGDKPKGKFSIDTLSKDLTTPEIAEKWHNILDSLNFEEMPPKKAKKHPSKGELVKVIEELTIGIHKAQEFFEPQMPKVTRRLSQREYRNTIYE